VKKLGPLRILLVEDSHTDARLLEIRLRESQPSGISLTRVETIREALEHINHGQFDVALLDLSLPDSAGLDTIIPVRAAAPFLPIVVLTGLAEEQLGLDAIDLGVQDFLSKREATGWHVVRAIRYAILRARADEDVQRANAELERRVVERTQQLQQLASEVLLVEQRERRRLAELLHDHLQQLLVSAKLQVGAAASRTRSAALRTTLESAEQQLAAAVEAARSLTADLSPPQLFTSGLGAALQWLGARMRELHGLNVVVVADENAEPHGEGSRILIFQSVRELLFNVVKHAGVAEARVELSRIDDVRIQLRVEDAGRGFALPPAPTPAGSFGLFSIQERLTHMGGTMRIKSTPGKGTRVTLVAAG
jgi:signal transduction histidine kinase